MIAVNAALTIRASKRIIHELLNPSTAFEPQACAALVQPCFESEDLMKCRRAFIEKRKPVLQGKWSPPRKTANQQEQDETMRKGFWGETARRIRPLRRM